MRVDVRILGALEVIMAGAPVDLGVRKARLCFGLLALQAGRPVPTDRLAETLWPAGPPPRWESALQSHISRLRNALEPGRTPRAKSRVIETRGDAYVLCIDDGDLDARRFERSATEARAALARGEFEVAAKHGTAALGEWRGPVLADLGEAASVSPEVARLEELRLIATEERAEAMLRLGEPAAVVADLEALVREHPLRERCWELLLLALYRGGRQADALRRFQDVRAILVGELGIEPGPALRELEGAILRHEASLGVAARAEAVPTPSRLAPEPLPPWLQPPDDAFVGRVVELGALARAFERTAAGTRRLVLVEGEPGIGKTRLVREACRDLAREGALVLGGRCAEQPLYVLQPFAEAIGRLATIDGERLARLVPADLGALASLVPELAVHATPMPALDADAHRYLLFRAVSNVLDAELAGRNVVLVLDDLQWAPGATLQLLAHVLRDDDRGGLLVVATARDTEPNDELEALAADLQRERRVERIALRGLGPEEVARLVAARGVEAPTGAVFARTEGNPFYVEELVRHLDESGGSLAQDAVPDSVRDTIARRLLRLPDETRRVLGIAAVAGNEFRLATVAYAADLAVEDADDSLVPAVRAGVVAERPAEPGRYGFSHALMQTVLRDGLGAARRARVHRRVGEALAATGGEEAEIARHLLTAGSDGSDPIPGIEAALRAAARAVERYTYDDAIALLQEAREVMSASGVPAPKLAYAVDLELTIALRSAGFYPEREPVLASAWARANELDDPEIAADVIIEGCATAGYPSEAWLDRITEVRAKLDPSSRGYLMLSAVLCHVLSLRPGDEARQLAEWAVARCRSFGPIERHTVLMHALQVLGASSPIERIVDLARGACDAARETGSAAELTVALSMLRLAYLAAGDLARSDDVANQYEDLVRAVRIPRYIAGVEQRRAMRALLAGRFAEAEAHANEAYAVQPTDEYFEGLAVQLFAICYEQGRLDEIRPGVEAWARHYDRPAWKLGYAVLLAESGEDDPARRIVTPFIDAGFTSVLPSDDLFFLSLAVAATTIVQIGEADAAPMLYDLLAPHASRVIVAAQGALCWGSIHRVLGPLAALAGNAERAAVHFEASMAVHERLGARPFLARDRLAYARMLRATGGDPVRIDDLQRTGLALARELGMRTLVDRY